MLFKQALGCLLVVLALGGHLQLGVPRIQLACLTVTALAGIARQVAAREYCTWRSFLADLELIFSNARQFNRPAHPVHKAANDLQQKCLKFLEERDGAALEKTAREVSSCCHILPTPFKTDFETSLPVLLVTVFISCKSQLLLV